MTRWRALGLLALTIAGCAGWRIRADQVADGLFAGDPAARVPWADAVAEAIGSGPAPRDPSDQYGGEQDTITCSLAILGLTQVAADDPGLEARYRGPVAACARFLISPVGRGYGTARWREDALDPSTQADGHAYLGWNAVGLAAAARMVDDPELVETSHRWAEILAQRLAALGPVGLETYPGERYPTDQAAVVAAVALDGQHPAEVRAFLERWQAAALDPATGLQYQSLGPSGAPSDVVRGSGSAISAWFLGYADPILARRLADAVDRALRGAVLGFGGVREVLPGAPFRMDIDSGPVVPGFGFGVAATGFGLADARIRGDPGFYRSCYRSAHLFGLPGRRWFWAGGTLGNAILLAAATAPPR